MGVEEYIEYATECRREVMRRPGDVGVGIGTKEHQHATFMAALEVVSDWTGKEVLDAGCGYGDLAPLLIERGVSRYLGVDLLDEAVEEAQRRFPGVAFLRGDFRKLTEKFDVVLALGVAGIEGGWPVLQSFVEQLLPLARIAVVVTAWSTAGIASLDGYSEYVDPRAFVSFCCKSCERWTVRHDYWGTEMMAYLFTDRFKRF